VSSTAALLAALANLMLCGPGGARPGDAAKVDALVAELRSPNPGRRGTAAMELGELGPRARAAVKPLAAALADEDLNVRYWAASALGAIGPGAAEAVPALVGALRTSFPGRGLKGPERYYADARAVCARSLGLIGAAARMALPALEEARKDEDPSVREAAAAAIERIKSGADKEATP